jgi:hypothetical protein
MTDCWRQTSGTCARGAGRRCRTGPTRTSAATLKTASAPPAAAEVRTPCILRALLTLRPGAGHQSAETPIHTHTHTYSITHAHIYMYAYHDRRAVCGDGVRAVHSAVHGDEAARAAARHQGDQAPQTRVWCRERGC